MLTYDNIKSHKKAGLFGKTEGGFKLTPPTFLGLKIAIPEYLTKICNLTPLPQQLSTKEKERIEQLLLKQQT